MFQSESYFIHDSCPPKLRGDGCCGDCFDCRYNDSIHIQRNELKSSPKIHIQLYLPGMSPQYYNRGIKTNGILYTDFIKVKLIKE